MHQRRVVFEGSAAAPVQSYTAILPGSLFCVVLLRLVMQDGGENWSTRGKQKVPYPSRKSRRSDASSKNNLRRIEETNGWEEAEAVDG